MAGWTMATFVAETLKHAYLVLSLYYTYCMYSIYSWKVQLYLVWGRVGKYSGCAVVQKYLTIVEWISIKMSLYYFAAIVWIDRTGTKKIRDVKTIKWQSNLKVHSWRNVVINHYLFLALSFKIKYEVQLSLTCMFDLILDAVDWE